MASAAVLACALGAVAIALGAAGSLTFVEQDKNGVGGVSGLALAIDVAVSPDGENAYVVGSSSNAVATFTRNADGTLTWLEQDVDSVGGVDGLLGARSVVVSPDGANVYVTGNGEAALASFERDPGTGALDFLGVIKDGDPGGVDGLAGAWGVATDADGDNVYVAANTDNSVATFDRGVGGVLSFVEVDKDTDPSVDGLAIATGVSVSPDGANVYVASCGDSAVATFTRTDATGALGFLERDKSGDAGVSAMACARGVAVSPDGNDVYVATESDDAVVGFDRDAGTGALAFAGFKQEGVDGVAGLNGARDLTISPDGKSIYVASLVSDSVASFSRATTGALTFVERDTDGVDGVDGLNGANGVAVSPNGASVYVTGETDAAVATFNREAPPADPPTTTTTTTTNPPPVPDVSRTLQLSVSKTKVKKGKKVTISGAIVAAQASCKAGQPVELLRRPKGKPSFQPRKQLSTAADGTFSVKEKLKKTAQFLATVAPGACQAATSPTRKVKVKKKKRR